MRMKRKDLTHFAYVRIARDDDRVLEFAELMQNGVNFPPILVAQSTVPEINNAIVDGRHREGAYELINVEDVEVKTVVVNSVEDFISLAYKENSGGALPPTREDTEHVVGMLVRARASKKSIADRLGIPVGIAGKYIESVKSKVRRANMIQARLSVADGMSVVEAAEKYDVPIDVLKAELGGHRRKTSDFADRQRKLTFNYKSAAATTAALMRALRDDLEEGDISREQVRSVLNHIRQLLKSAMRTTEDWEKRLLPKTKGEKS